MSTNDGYPRFSEAEMGRRRQVILEIMGAGGVDHLVVYGSERSGSGVPWLTQWPVTTEAALLHTPDERDVLLVQHYNHLPNARLIASEADVRWGGPSTMTTLAELIRERLGEGQRVGIIGPIGQRAYRRLAESIGELVSLDDAYTGLRLVKSDEEIDRLRVAADMSDRAVLALADQVQPGMDERGLAAIVENAYLAEGGTNHIHYFATTPMAAPEICVPAQFQSTRMIEPGDVMFCEISANFWGYAGQVLRTFAIADEPSPLIARLHQAADAAFDAIVSVVRPGAHARELVEASSVIEEMGFTIFDDLVHGYGGGYLPPVLGSASRAHREIPDLSLETGMALVVQPNVITLDEKAGVQTGQLIVVTEDGYESLHHAPRGLLRIG
ncbi:MAG: M24 family metallopeptidase [Acidimicrobiia bacterium]